MVFIDEIYANNERSINSVFEDFKAFVGPKSLISVKRNFQYQDEPKFWSFSSFLNKKVINDGLHFHSKGSGFSFFSPITAFVKSVAEAIERTNNYVFLQRFVDFTGSHTTNSSCVNPQRFSYFDEQQLERRDYKNYQITKSSSYRWSTCTELLSGKAMLLPAQLIYLSYPFMQNEPILYPLISTGCAGGSSLSGAIIRGIYEVVERDSFMIFYLNMIVPPQIDLHAVSKNDERIKYLLEVCRRYLLTIKVVDLTTDLTIPVYAAIVIDRTGIGKAISIGLKADLNPINAIIGAIEEAMHTRGWVRKEYEKNKRDISHQDLLLHPSIINRGLFWFPKSKIKLMNFMLKSKKRTPVFLDPNQSTNTNDTLKQLISIFSTKKYPIYFKNITLPEFTTTKYFTVKIICPDLHPLYLDEKHPVRISKRMQSVPQILGYTGNETGYPNLTPHPFL